VTENQVMAQNSASMIEQVVIDGDLAALQPQQRVIYYKNVCETLGLNPLTKPFAYIRLNGKLTLYALRGATDQLRQLRGISVELTERETINGVHIVTAKATDTKGRSDTSTGAVSIDGLKGEKLANALMKAETKAKRRVTLSLVGLGWLDESELATVPTAQPVTVDQSTGEITDGRQQQPMAKRKPPARPYNPETLKLGFTKRLKSDSKTPPSTGHKGATIGALNSLFTFKGADADAAKVDRHAVTEYLLGKPESIKWTASECDALLAWAQTRDGDGQNVPNAMAMEEAALIVELMGDRQEPEEEQVPFDMEGES